MGQEFRWIIVVSERQDRQRIYALTIIEVEIPIALEGPFGDSCRRNALHQHVQIFDPCDQTANAPSQWWGRRAVHHCTSHPNTSGQSLLRNRSRGVPMHSVTLKFEIKGYASKTHPNATCFPVVWNRERYGVRWRSHPARVAGCSDVETPERI